MMNSENIIKNFR